jgi:hypothetical protein
MAVKTSILPNSKANRPITHLQLKKLSVALPLNYQIKKCNPNQIFLRKMFKKVLVKMKI